MVLLTMTKSMVEGLQKVESNNVTAAEDEDQFDKGNKLHQLPDEDVLANRRMNDDDNGRSKKNNYSDLSSSPRSSGTERDVYSSTRHTEPSLLSPRLGNPISHGQVIDLSMQLREAGSEPYRLEGLLRGSKVYIAPPPPKSEPTSEYKALMARLRREEEFRAYERMTHPLPPTETFSQKFHASSAAFAFSSNQDPISTTEDDITYADVDRQMALIFNVLISIVACAGGLWVVARWWNTPARLALSMGGSLLVGLAEVVVYSGYIRRVGEAKGKAKGMKEIKEVVNTWVVGEADYVPEPVNSSLLVTGKRHTEESNARQRRKPAL